MLPQPVFHFYSENFSYESKERKKWFFIVEKFPHFLACVKSLPGKGSWDRQRTQNFYIQNPLLRVCKTENLEIKHVDLTFKEDWFKKINPKQLLPALQLDDGSVLTESVDICKYFCDQVGGNYLWPGTFWYFDLIWPRNDLNITLSMQGPASQDWRSYGRCEKAKIGLFCGIEIHRR